MVPFPPIRRAALLAALLTLPLSATACHRAMDTGLALAGMRRGIAPRSPAAVTSAYEHTPSLEWRRYAVGRPYSPAYSLFQGVGPSSCSPVPQGLSRVLPVAEGLPAHDLQEIGPLSVGVAGVPVMTAAQLLASGRHGLAQNMLERTSWLATSGEGCTLNVFAYARLGIGASNEPVAVLR